MSAPFLEPPSRDFGVRWFGQRAFGGILQNDDQHWIPQYNLQNYWKRAIPPTLIGLAEPLIPPRIRGGFRRLPGHFQYKSKEYELYNRNLLAAKYEEAEGVMKVWTVNERSKRHYLEGFEIEINNGQPQPDKITPTLTKKLKMIPPAKSEDVPKRHSEPLLELRTSLWSTPDSTSLFLRSPTLLQMLELTEHGEQQTPIFHTAVKSFAESPMEKGKLVVVDFGGRAWMLQEPISDKLGNHEELYQNVVFTDHPMKLALASHFHVEIVDSRCSASSMLWRVPEFSTRGHEEPLYFQETSPSPPMIRHVAKLPNGANSYLAMTEFSMVLLDDRFAGKPVLEVRHPFSTGGHRLIVAEKPILEEDGEIFPILSLEQLPILTSSVSMTKLYRHNSGLWSAVDSFHSLGEPHAFNATVRRGKYAEGSEVVEEPTRAVALVEMHENSLLLRQTDDGAIWWQNLRNSEVSKKRMAAEELESARRVQKTLEQKTWQRDDWQPIYAEEMSEDVKESRRIAHFQIEIEEIDAKMIARCARRAHDAQRTVMSGEERMKTLEVAEEGVNSLLSKITMDTWRESEKKMEAAKLS